MKYILAFIISLVSITCFSQQNKAYVKDGRIVVETAQGVKSIDYSQSPGQRYSRLQKWTVEEEVDKVGNALSVFRKRSEPLYKRKIWIFDKNGKQKIFIEYTSGDDDTGIIFSPDEDFVFWLGRSWFGRPVVYGRKLSKGRNFAVANATNFELITCDNQQTYVVIKKAMKDATYYYIHDLNGRKKKSCSNRNICACIGK